jgi:hypothetical protein
MPSRVCTSPPTIPRQAWLSASTAIMTCATTPYVLPFFTGPRPRRRSAVVANFTSVVSPASAGASLDRQHMPASDRCAGPLAPTLDDLRGGYFRVGEEPARLQFATTVTPQPAQAHRLACDHPFEDRAPPWSRRTSPNDPSDHSISAPVLRLPG